jgi:hypothetical protein
MPDSIIRTEDPVITYTFSSELYGNLSITALGHDVSNADIYGFGQYVVNLDIIRINSLKTAFENNLIPVPSVPFSFTIEADIYHENDTPYSWEWTVDESQGVAYTINGFETAATIEIQKITELPASMVVTYTLEACGRILENTLSITLQTTDLWGYPVYSFYPLPDGIPDTTSEFSIECNKILTKASGDLLLNSDLDSYITITMNPDCPGIVFNKSIEYMTSGTIFMIEQVNAATQQPDTLCNGEYTFTVNSEELFTQSYRLTKDNDTSKTFTVSNNAINDHPGLLRANVYPNPFRDIVHVTFDDLDDYCIQITDLQGQVQKTGNYSGVNQININLETLSEGVYILRAQNAGGTKQFSMKINKITH